MEPSDVAIIGAGAAGIGAARRLAEAGLTAVLFEASQRVGGRAWTLQAAGMPLDLGCGWLHSASRNPLVQVAADIGFEVDRHSPPWGQSVPQPGFPMHDQDEANEAYGRWHERMLATPLPDDVAAGHLAPGNRWNPHIEALSGFMNGVALDELSIEDYARYESAATDENWRPVRGYGSLVASSLPVGTACALATPVTALSLPGGGGITLATARGDHRASAAIITVSTSVLSGHAMRLPGALDPWREAAAKLPLGHDEKLFLEITDDAAFPSEGHAIGDPYDAATVAYHIRPLGRPMIECFLGGASARRLAEEGTIAAYEHVMAELVGLFGQQACRGLRYLAASGWHSDTYIGGAYSHALPTHASARQRLAAPYDNRVFFAGEATHADAFSTAHGAYLSGIRAADEVIASRSA